MERLAILNVPHPAVMLRFLTRSSRQMLKSWYAGFFSHVLYVKQSSVPPQTKRK